MEETEMHGSEKRGGREDTPVSRRYSLTVTRNRMRSRFLRGYPDYRRSKVASET